MVNDAKKPWSGAGGSRWIGTVDGGLVSETRCTERWRIETQRKCGLQAVHLPIGNFDCVCCVGQKPRILDTW